MEEFSINKLKDIIANVVGVAVKDITDISGMDIMGRWDSFAVVNLVVAIEVEANIEVGPNELEYFKTYQGILSILSTKGIRVVS